jgi:choline dehydrogenase-like flavoprotein
MLIDGRSVRDGTVMQADCCVIGSGAAGITVARELARTRARVLLLESGGFEFDPKTQALNDGQVVGEPLDPTNPLRLQDTRLRYFGGTTNHWAGYCRPLEPGDMERRDHVRDSGWPITRADLDPWYRLACDVIQIGAYEFDPAYWEAQEGAGLPLVANERLQTSLYHIHGLHFGEEYRRELTNAGNVSVCLWSNATKIALAPDGGSVAGIDVASLEGNRWRAQARTYVLATGAVEVPRLLLASNDVATSGVGNANDNVGRYFAEHLQLLGGIAVLAPSVQDLRLYKGTNVPIPGKATETFGLVGGFRLSEETLRSEELLGLEVTFPYLDPVSKKAADETKHVRSDDVLQLVEAVNTQPPQSRGLVKVQAEQAPNRASRVKLTTDKDPLGVQRVALDWQLTRLDRESIVRGLRVLGTEIGRAAQGRIQVSAGKFVPPDATGDHRLRDLDFGLGTGFHHMGTARMSADPRKGVVDADCRVHGVPNLRVAGSSVFPTGSNATPTYTIVALALRLADDIRRELGV